MNQKKQNKFEIDVTIQLLEQYRFENQKLRSLNLIETLEYILEVLRGIKGKTRSTKRSNKKN
jgi:hypothetical protein